MIHVELLGGKGLISKDGLTQVFTNQEFFFFDKDFEELKHRVDLSNAKVTHIRLGELA